MKTKAKKNSRPPTAAAPSPGRSLLFAAILAAAVFAAYANSLRNGFVWVDYSQIVRGELIARDAGEALRMFVSPQYFNESAGAGGYYRAMTNLSYSIVQWIFGQGAFGFHLANVLLHVGAVLLLFVLLKRLIGAAEDAFWPALLFALHPVLTADVTFISGRPDLLAGFFCFAGLILALDSCRAPQGAGRALRLAASAVCLLAALMSKEVAIVFPGLFLLCAWAAAGEDGKRNGLRDPAVWKALAAFAAVCVFYLALRRVATGDLGSGVVWAHGPAALAFTQAAAVGEYLRVLTAPIRLNMCDAIAIAKSPFDGPAFIGMAAMLALAAAAYFLRRKNHWATFGVIWFFIALSPVSNLIPLKHFRSERFLYLPAAGYAVALFAFVKAALGAIPDGRKRAFALRAAMTAAALAFGALSVYRSFDYKDAETFARATVATRPYCPEGRSTLGMALMMRGDAEGALAEWQEAVAPHEGYAAFLDRDDVYGNIGVALYQLRRYEEAKNVYAGLLEMFPDNGDFQNKMAAALHSLGDMAGAERHVRRAVLLDPGNDAASFNLCGLFIQKGQVAEGLSFFQKLPIDRPIGAGAHFCLAELMARQGNLTGAKTEAGLALKINPGFEPAARLLEQLP